MPIRNTANPGNLSVIQALLDLQGAGIDVTHVIDQCKKDPRRVATAEATFKAHQYPDKSVTYAMISNARDNSVLENLDIEAAILLMLYIKNMYVNNYVSCTRKQAIALLHITERTYVRIRKQLLDYGCIAIARPYKRGSAEVIMVNPEIACVGKNKDTEIEEFWELVNDQKIADNYNMLNVQQYDYRKITESGYKYQEIIPLDDSKSAIDPHKQANGTNKNQDDDNTGFKKNQLTPDPELDMLFDGQQEQEVQ